jgi:hypothetical protein
MAASFEYAYRVLQGQRVEVRTLEGDSWHGVFTAFFSTSLVLSDPVPTAGPRAGDALAPGGRTLVPLASIVSIHAHDVKDHLAMARGSSSGGDSLATDSDIAGGHAALNGRALQAASDWITAPAALEGGLGECAQWGHVRASHRAPPPPHPPFPQKRAAVAAGSATTSGRRTSGSACGPPTGTSCTPPRWTSPP